jgi:hypothetical protein
LTLNLAYYKNLCKDADDLSETDSDTSIHNFELEDFIEKKTTRPVPKKSEIRPEIRPEIREKEKKPKRLK